MPQERVLIGYVKLHIADITSVTPEQLAAIVSDALRRLPLEELEEILRIRRREEGRGG